MLFSLLLVARLRMRLSILPVGAGFARPRTLRAGKPRPYHVRRQNRKKHPAAISRGRALDRFRLTHYPYLFAAHRMKHSAHKRARMERDNDADDQSTGS